MAPNDPLRTLAGHLFSPSEAEMQDETIAEVGVDEEGRPYVRPSAMSFDYIYRAAMEVHWDAVEGRLFSPKPREWTYTQWFAQIVAAAADEYGVV